MDPDEMASFSEAELSTITDLLLRTLELNKIDGLKAYAAMKLLCQTLEDIYGIGNIRIEESEIN